MERYESSKVSEVSLFWSFASWSKSQAFSLDLRGSVVFRLLFGNWIWRVMVCVLVDVVGIGVLVDVSAIMFVVWVVSICVGVGRMRVGRLVGMGVCVSAGVVVGVGLRLI